ncbi:branched-chain amino acid ABC transporter substrate-binding protein [Helicobacter monodelphidis]|uniref:ABC transporter substrate-binding protein n=1 Tax=Helicobacter sp. 15-1451 TaxID=2004995 RepID=UPI000DCE92AD|nr:ABC transporter substrate-binding protein [Helicobacter sp. 15-1451]RAX57584.1 branched-chain amino acid ABC transporter substrate-binding protein [Helicobacter sp. 15-1451]
MKKWSLGIALSALSLCACLQADEIKAGVVMPLSGAVAGYGQAGYRGLELMQELMPQNEKGDSLKFIIVDNKSEKIESANAIRKLVSSDKVDIVFGPMITTNALAMAKTAEDSKTPLVPAVATGDRVTKGKKFVTRIAFADSFQGTINANFAYNDLKAKTAAILFDSSSDYSIGLTMAFKEQFQKLGGKIVAESEFKAGGKDFKAQLSNVKAKNPDVLFIPVYYNEAALIMVQYQQLGLKMPVVGGDGVASNKIFFDVGKEATEGVMVTDYYSTNSQQTELGKKFIQAYENKYKESVSSFSMMFADAYVLALKAVAECPKNDKVCLNDKIRNVENFEGVSGVFSLKNGEAIRSAVINEVKNGQLVYKTTVNP